MAKWRAALGIKVRTGRAVVVVMGGPTDAPRILAKAHIQVAFTFDEGAVYHVAQELPVDEARELLRRAEARFTELARSELAAIVKNLDTKIAAALMVAPPEKRLPKIDSILKVHPLVHAAEGELYRRVFATAARAVGAGPTRVAAGDLTQRASKALEMTPAKLTARLSALGKASGKPWAADQKEAALAAWLALAGCSAPERTARAAR